MTTECRPTPPPPFILHFNLHSRLASMDHFPPDRFPSEHPPATSFSSSHPPSMPPPQSSFRSPDEPDPFKISFLKGPKRKRLAKVCMRAFNQAFTALTPSSSTFRYISQACDACHKSKRRCDGTGQLTSSWFIPTRSCIDHTISALQQLVCSSP